MYYQKIEFEESMIGKCLDKGSGGLDEPFVLCVKSSTVNSI